MESKLTAAPAPLPQLDDAAASRSADAVLVLASLAHEARLEIFRQLVQAGPSGLAAGEIAARLGMPPSTLSFHLAHLARAGLVAALPAGRQIIYTPVFERVRGLTDYLLENCCGGASCAPEQAPGGACAPAVDPRARAAASLNLEATMPLSGSDRGDGSCGDTGCRRT
jgi:ArsR family transcriptional regulator